MYMLNSTILLIIDDIAFRAECPLEDHELIKDVMARWPSKNPPKLVLKDFASKNILWSVNPPVRLQ